MDSFFQELARVAEITIPLLLKGVLVTIEISFMAIAFSIILGFLLGYMALSENKIIKLISQIYIKIFRCTPFMVQVYLAYYGSSFLGLDIPAYWTGVIILSLYTASYIAVIMEGGIRSLPKGQSEAALSMGMGRLKMMWRILLPQTFSVIIPSLTGQFVQTVKDSSILSIITVAEMTMMTKEAIGITFSPLIVYICAGVFYWCINIVIEVCSHKIENKHRQVNS